MTIKVLRRFGAFLLWSGVFLALLVALDQLLLRTASEAPGVRAVQSFYLDFRQRLQGLPRGKPAVRRPLPAAAPTQPPAAGTAKPAGVSPAPPTASPPGYVYADEEGSLQFADTLQEVPSRYRGEARPLQP